MTRKNMMITGGIILLLIVLLDAVLTDQKKEMIAAQEARRIKDSLALMPGETADTTDSSAPAEPKASLSYKVLKVDKAPDQYGPATKVYVWISNVAQLEQVNAELIKKYRGNQFMQAYYYTDAAMQNRAAVYTYNPSRNFEDLARDE